MKITSLICGVLMLGLWIFPWVGLVVALAGLTIGILAIIKDRNKLVILAVVLNVLGLAFVTYNFAYRIVQDSNATTVAVSQDETLNKLDQFLLDLKYYDNDIIEAIGQIEESIQKAKFVLSTMEAGMVDNVSTLNQAIVSMEKSKESATKLGIYIEETIEKLESYRSLYVGGFVTAEDIDYKLTSVKAELVEFKI